MHVLVTGGARYIGSAIVHSLLQDHHRVRVLDDLSTGHIEALTDDAEFLFGSLLDPTTLSKAVRGVDAVIHCAGKSLVSESVANPEKYRLNNVEGSRLLIAQMIASGVDRMVFSSSAATYAGADHPLVETNAEEPSNPYGESKLAVDRLLQDADFKGASLRYFNVAGAISSRGHWYGERHHPESHLIPNVLSATTANPLQVYGDDWPTEDGTCIRDYIHIDDLVRAHLSALEAPGFEICNLGTGVGISVMTVIKTAERVLGRKVPFAVASRREGDPAVLTASSEKAERLWNWSPERTLEEMIEDAESFRRRPW